MRVLLLDSDEKNAVIFNDQPEEKTTDEINSIYKKRTVSYQGELSFFDVVPVFPGFGLTEAAIKQLDYDVVCIEGDIYTEKRGETGSDITPILRKLTDLIYCFYHPIVSEEVLFQPTGFITWVNSKTLKKCRQYVTIVHRDVGDKKMKDISASALRERILERAHEPYPYSKGHVTHEQNDWCYPEVHTDFSDVVVNGNEKPEVTTGFVVYPTVGVKLEIVELKDKHNSPTRRHTWKPAFIWIDGGETTFTHDGKDYELTVYSFTNGEKASSYTHLAKHELTLLHVEDVK